MVFLLYTYILNFNESRLLVSFASLTESGFFLIKIMNIVIIMPNKYAMYMVEKVYNDTLDYVILLQV